MRARALARVVGEAARLPVESAGVARSGTHLADVTAALLNMNCSRSGGESMLYGVLAPVRQLSSKGDVCCSEGEKSGAPCGSTASGRPTTSIDAGARVLDGESVGV